MTDACPGEDDLLACAEGRLAPDPRAALEAHLDGCAACRGELAALVRFLGPSTAAAEPSPLERIGRYIVLRRLGAGAMGVVYAAYDPELDRKIAVKVLHTHRSAADQARLLREAQALARLGHPNVVAVYDAGAIDGRVFMAMEFVDGATLAAWRTARHHSRGELLATLIQAGRGLIAAHAAGVVHRDFKPDNVLVGTDGRVRVSDFGLASTSANSAEDSLVDLRDLTGASPTRLTRTGALVGTPAYMAPEQWLGQPVDARTDQFAFAIALYEALTGRHPFMTGDDDFASLRAAVLGGHVPRPPGKRMPLRIYRAVCRALRVDPVQRFPTLAELLAELEPPPVRRRLWLPVAGAAALAAGWLNSRDAAPLCLVDRLGDVWSPARADQVEQALSAAPAGHAAEVASRVRSALDIYAEKWRALYSDVCQATHVRGDQSPQLLDLRMQCLERRRLALAGLVDVLLVPGVELVDTAIQAAVALPRLDPCSDPVALRAQRELPDAPHARGQLAAAQALLARGRALLDAGRYTQGLVLAEDALRASLRLAYRPLEAEAQLLRAELYERTIDLDAARTAAREAVWAAEAAGEYRVAARAWLLQTTQVRLSPEQPAEVEALTRHADRILEHIGGDPEITALRSTRLARAAWAIHDIPRSVTLAELGVQQLRALHGPVDPRVASALNSLGAALWAAGRPVDARAAYVEALAIDRAVLGSGHPAVAILLTNIGELDNASGAAADARALHLEALGIAEASLGPRHGTVAAILANLGSSTHALGDVDGALALTLRALEIARDAVGPDDGFVAILHTTIGQRARLLGDTASAIDHGRRGHATMQALFGDLAIDTLGALCGTAAALQDAGDVAAATPLLDQVIASLDRGVAPRSLHAVALARRARIWLATSQPALAAAALTRGEPMLDSGPEVRAVHTLALAELADLRPGGRPAARALALRASLLAHDAHDRPIAGAVRRWLADHPPQAQP